jgi:hypothetical protein
MLLLNPALSMAGELAALRHAWLVKCSKLVELLERVKASGVERREEYAETAGGARLSRRIVAKDRCANYYWVRRENDTCVTARIGRTELIGRQLEVECKLQLTCDPVPLHSPIRVLFF